MNILLAPASALALQQPGPMYKHPHGDAVALVAALRFCMMHPCALCACLARVATLRLLCVFALCSHFQVVMLFVFRLTCLFAWWPPRGEGPSSGGHQANIKYNMERRTQGKQQQKTDCSMFLILKCSLFGERACLTKYVLFHYMCFTLRFLVVGLMVCA